MFAEIAGSRTLISWGKRRGCEIVSVNFGRASPEFMVLMLMLMLGHCRVWSQMLVCVRCCVCVRALCVCLCTHVCVLVCVCVGGWGCSG